MCQHRALENIIIYQWLRKLTKTEKVGIRPLKIISGSHRDSIQPKRGPQLSHCGPSLLSSLRSRPCVDVLLIRREIRNPVIHLFRIGDWVVFVFDLANLAVPLNNRISSSNVERSTVFGWPSTKTRLSSAMITILILSVLACYD
jgi:hypothetical protein